MKSPSTQPPPLPDASPQLEIAGMGVRILALAMDMVFVAALSSFLLIKVLLPQEHSEGMRAAVELYQSYQTEVEAAMVAGESMPWPETISKNEAILAMESYAQQAVLLICFLYFAICEWWLRGGSLGKHTLGLRTAMAGGLFPPMPLQAILRAAIKSYALVALPPFTWILLLVALFVSGRRGVHDLVAKTIVIRLPGAPPKT